MTILLKVGIVATLTAGVIGGSAGISYWNSLPKDLKGLLQKERVNLLDVESTKDDDSWKKLAERHSATGVSITLDGGKVVNKIEDLTITPPASSTTVDFSKLKNECKKLFEKPISQEKSFNTAKQNAKDWCSSDSDALTKELATIAGALPGVGG